MCDRQAANRTQSSLIIPKLPPQHITPLTDTEVPVIVIDTSFPVGANVTAKSYKDGIDGTSDRTSATIVFPNITASDEGGTAPINIICSGRFLPAGSLTYKTGVEAEFFIGTTEITCTATDDAGNTSPPVTFNVTVCAFGYSFVGGVCVGECSCLPFGFASAISAGS
jgi:hypothetical protein